MNKLIRDSIAEFLIFTSQNTKDSIKVKVFDESVWLTQNIIAELFETTSQNVTLHINNIFEDEELQESLVSSILEHTKTISSLVC